MNKIIKVVSILFFAGFSFFYTDKVTNLIKKNDPIMKKILEVENDKMVSKVEPIVMNDEYITGINGCKVDVSKSYNKMKEKGDYKEDYLVFTEDEVNNYDKYIIGGNKEKRNVSLIFIKILNKKVTDYLKDKDIVINYFFDGEFIKDNLDILKETKDYSKIYYYGRNNEYSSKYITYDNYLINNNLNKSNYCLVTNKDDKVLNLCKSYKMKTIKTNPISTNIYSNIKVNLSNGNIFLIDNDNNNEIIVTIKYIISRGYKIVNLDELLDEKNNCN